MNQMIENTFKKKNVLVMGDLMVDEYVTGSVKRISPEAPVPILNLNSISKSAGGAANVVKNIRLLGANVFVVGILADDNAGKWLRDALNNQGINTDGIFAEQNRPTIIKTRYATKGQQLLRVDNEIIDDISDELKKYIMQYLEKKITQMDAVILSDYCKGFFEDAEFVKKIIKVCNNHQVFVAIDSKSKDINRFSGADLVKPNNLELEKAVGIQIKDIESLDKAGHEYLQRSGAKMLVVTRGANGISVFQNNQERKDFAAEHAVQVYDVTGAGDTVISTAVLAFTCGASVNEAIRLANMAAGIVISKVGTVAIEWKELSDYVKENKIN